MKKNVLLIFYLLINFNLHSQVLDGIYYDGVYKPLIPPIYHTYFINTKWNDSLALVMHNTLKADTKKLPVFSDCILMNENASSSFISQATNAYYTDSGQFSIDTLMNLSINTHLDLTEFSSPYYFRKFEVTNKEYREFTNWVRDSIARTLLAENGIEGYREVEYDFDGYENPKLIWKKKIEWDSEDPEYRAALADMYLPENERFYQRKEFDVRRFVYDYIYYVDGLRYRERICTYPDTLAWIRYGEQDALELMSKIYFIDEEYDNYPVVGISWNQARAYLHWREQQINQSLQKKYPGIEIELELPTVIEWEHVNGQITDRVHHFFNPWLCNLITGKENKYKESLVVLVDSNSVKVEPVVYSHNNSMVFNPNEPRDYYYTKENVPGAKYIKTIEDDTTIFINGDEYKITTRKWVFELDNTGSFFNPLPWFGTTNTYTPNALLYPITSPANLLLLKDEEKITIKSFDVKKIQTIHTSHLKGKYLYNEVSFIEGNVSEWMLNDYKNWQPGFEAHMLQLENKESVDAVVEYDLEMLGDYWNDKNGKLIKGSNWYHDACTQEETIDADVQRFADPDSSFSTVGFRYVIHIKTLPKK